LKPDSKYAPKNGVSIMAKISVNQLAWQKAQKLLDNPVYYGVEITNPPPAQPSSMQASKHPVVLKQAKS
jgi:hypothetical protein